jgi:hypothetical protein
MYQRGEYVARGITFLGEGRTTDEKRRYDEENGAKHFSKLPDAVGDGRGLEMAHGSERRIQLKTTAGV